ncbi:MAG: hypothetical protein ACI8UO_002424 [Verrucomicrobiales bacterium]|jgi:hypothetical protein
MRCVTDIEVSEWLCERSVPEDPYRGDTTPDHYVQFYTPSAHRRLDAFVRHYYERIIPDSETMVHMTDWGLYLPSEMIAIVGVRSSIDEKRRLIDAPGHWMTSAENETGISLLSLSASFAWSSYLYCPTQRSTLYNWEGEIFDFWTDSVAAVDELKLIMKQFGLAETAKGEQDAGHLDLTRRESDT